MRYLLILLLVILCLLVLGSVTHSQPNEIWREESTAEQSGSGVDLDLSGNVISTGLKSGAGWSILKYDPNGDLIWTVTTGDVSSMVSYATTSLATDSLGNIYITGYFERTTSNGASTVPFPSRITPAIEITTSTAGINIFFAKYDPDGKILWASITEDGVNCKGFEVRVQSDNSPVFFGYISTGGGDVNFYNGIPSSGTAGNVVASASTASNTFSMLIAKFTPSGTLQWISRTSGISATAYGGAISKTTGDEIFVTGYVVGSADPTEEVNFLSCNKDLDSDDHLVPCSGSDISINTQTALLSIYVAKYTTDGNIEWVVVFKAQDGTGSRSGNSVATNLAGDVFVTGFFSGTVQFGAQNVIHTGTGTELFVARIDNDGNFRWVYNDASVEIGNEIAVRTYIGGPEVFVTGRLQSGGVYLAGFSEEGNLLANPTIEGESGNSLATQGCRLALTGETPPMFTSLFATCSNCSANQFVDPFTGLCTACPIGSVSPPFDPTILSNITLPLGDNLEPSQAPPPPLQVAARLGCKNALESAIFFPCEPCAPGTEPAANGTCVNCTEGEFSPKFGSICLACPAGQHAPQPGSAQCIPCAPGTFTNESGQATCQACELGTFNPYPGATACIPCQAGETSTSQRLQCISCPPGTYSSSQGLCIPCKVGRYNPDHGSSQCLKCPENTFSNIPGSTSCTNCPPGYWSSFGASTCIPFNNWGYGV